MPAYEPRDETAFFVLDESLFLSSSVGSCYRVCRSVGLECSRRQTYRLMATRLRNS
jgi:hypothetical protein